MEILSVSKQKEISVYDLRNGWELNGTIQSKVLAVVFRIASEIERDLVSPNPQRKKPAHEHPL